MHVKKMTAAILSVSVYVLSALVPVSAQDSFCSAEGTVRDKVTREPIGAANVIVVGMPRGAAADLDGSYRITHIPPGTYSLTASAVGYQPVTLREISLSPSRPSVIEFLLQPTVIEGEAVTVTAEIIEVSPTEMPTSSRTLRYEEVRRAPGAIEDVQRMVQSLPGVVASNDSDNELVVRGGSPTENLTVIDGIEVMNTNHLTFGDEGQGGGGPINALNTEFLEDVTFASGGFSARYGDRMSSVLDLNLREGNRDHAGGSGELSMMGLGGHLESPLPGKKGSLLWTVHRSYLELLPEGSVPTPTVPVYWSSQAKMTYDLSQRHYLTVNGFYSEDNQTFRPEDKEKAGEDFSIGMDGLDFNTEKHFVGARLRSLWGSGFMDVVVAHNSQYAHWEQYSTQDDGSLRTSIRNQRTDEIDQLHFHYSGKAYGRDEWGTGFSLKPSRYKQEFWAQGDSLVYDDDVLGVDAGLDPDTFYYSDVSKTVDEWALKRAVYLQYTWRPGHGLAFTAGVRHDGLDVSSETAIDPRVSLVWDVTPQWTLSVAWGLYHQSQNLDLYLDPTVIASNAELPYSKAVQYVCGLSYSPRSSTRISVEGYYKDYKDLLVAEEEIVREMTGDWTYQSDVYLPERTKTSWGVEFFAHQKLSFNWYGTLSYSYGQTESTDPAYGTYDDEYDMRNVFTGVLGYKTTLLKFKAWRKALSTPVLGWLLWPVPVNGDELTLSTRYRYVTGAPYTRQVWYAEGETSPQPVYEGHWESAGHNNVRYPDYSRWDLRLDNKYWFGQSALIVYVSMINVLDEINVAEYYFNDDGTISAISQYRQAWVLGLRYEF